MLEEGAAEPPPRPGGAGAADGGPPARPVAGDPGETKQEDIDPLSPLSAAQAAFQRAEAARLTALLDGDEEAMAVLAAVVGDDAGDRDRPFARSFLLEAAQVLQVHERTPRLMLDAAQVLRRSFPRSWAAFAEGRVTWRETELVRRQAQGLDPDRDAEYDAGAAAPVPVMHPCCRQERRGTLGRSSIEEAACASS